LCSPDAGEAGRLALPLKIVKKINKLKNRKNEKKIKYT
jgi:hypothetical protein